MRVDVEKTGKRLKCICGSLNMGQGMGKCATLPNPAPGVVGAQPRTPPSQQGWGLLTISMTGVTNIPSGLGD